MTPLYYKSPIKFAIWSLFFKGSQKIEEYFDFIEDWYNEHFDDLSDTDIKRVQSKLPRLRESWPYQVSHLLLIGMKRQARPDKRDIFA